MISHQPSVLWFHYFGVVILFQCNVQNWCLSFCLIIELSGLWVEWERRSFHGNIVFICFKVFSSNLRVLWLDRLAFCNSDCDRKTGSSLISTTPSLQLPVLREKHNHGPCWAAVMRHTWIALHHYCMPLFKRLISSPVHARWFPCRSRKAAGRESHFTRSSHLTCFLRQGTHFSWPTKRPVVWWGVAEVTNTSSLLPFSAESVCPWEPNLFLSACTMVSP